MLGARPPARLGGLAPAGVGSPTSPRVRVAKARCACRPSSPSPKSPRASSTTSTWSPHRSRSRPRARRPSGGSTIPLERTSTCPPTLAHGLDLRFDPRPRKPRALHHRSCTAALADGRRTSNPAKPPPRDPTSFFLSSRSRSAIPVKLGYVDQSRDALEVTKTIFDEIAEG